MSKVTMGYGGFYICLSGPQGVSAWWMETAQTHVLVLSRSLLLNRLEPQSSKAKLSIPIMPIGIVAYAFTLLRDNRMETAVCHGSISPLEQFCIFPFSCYIIRYMKHKKIPNCAKGNIEPQYMNSSFTTMCLWTRCSTLKENKFWNSSNKLHKPSFLLHQL